MSKVGVLLFGTFFVALATLLLQNQNKLYQQHQAQCRADTDKNESIVSVFVPFYIRRLQVRAAAKRSGLGARDPAYLAAPV